MRSGRSRAGSGASDTAPQVHRGVQRRLAIDAGSGQGLHGAGVAKGAGQGLEGEQRADGAGQQKHGRLLPLRLQRHHGGSVPGQPTIADRFRQGGKAEPQERRPRRQARAKPLSQLAHQAQRKKRMAAREKKSS